MKVIDILNNAEKTVFSFEIIPPLRGSSVETIYNAIEPLMDFNPPHINITYHRDEVEYRTDTDGTIKKIVTTKRPGSVALAAAIMKRFKVEVVPHLLCAGATKYELENDLIDLNFLGIENVFALRGDASKNAAQNVSQSAEAKIAEFKPEQGGHRYASELVEQIYALNNGQYLDTTLKDPAPTNFCTGVAGYPEKHYEAASIEVDIENLKRKIDAGAEYIVTQLFFDNSKFFDFVNRCRAAGITVPVIPGLKPISTAKHLELLPKTFSIDIPEDLIKEVQSASDVTAVRKIGVEWAVMQSKELIAAGAPAVHYYSMGKSDNIVEIAKRVF
ncbi:MAG: methylenetetrahydrofolate reductase [Bacteroidales bacterium]|nr:methylenetetrahydrofolate reductase [Bacteroidales bacterium]